MAAVSAQDAMQYPAMQTAVPQGIEVPVGDALPPVDESLWDEYPKSPTSRGAHADGTPQSPSKKRSGTKLKSHGTVTKRPEESSETGVATHTHAHTHTPASLTHLQTHTGLPL